ncbi:helix-turn-helix domain-containing protein [Lacibacterium aquatile]|uniref:Helix-turn-helix domain-containing protein n=1 Tax=Lacibacterium aquatile TaxID=1168082 RepID=A0ABW5DSH5_9PROT
MRSGERHDTVRIFRERLLEVIRRTGLSQTAFAEAVGIDRSTLSQLLSPTNERLPRIDSIIGVAHYAQVSLDWLFGLTQQDSLGADVVPETFQVERNAPSPLDERLLRWHAEAAGYKIRHVPTSFPDVLKTEAVINVEYSDYFARSPKQRIETTQARLAYLRQPETDMEVCTSLQAIEGFARGENGWSELSPKDRREQIDHIIDLCNELYPSFRWFLFDVRQVFSVPITIFGPQRAVIYIGQMYFVFHSTDHIRTLAQHFDSLIRAAVVQPTDIPRYLERLRSHIR